MSHILVKWASTEQWDVYETRRMVDVATATSIMKDATVVEALVGKTFKVLWKDGDEACDAYLVAAGEADKMERKRTKLATRAERNPLTKKTPCCDHVSQIEALMAENAVLKERLREHKDLIDTSKMLKKLQRAVDKLTSASEGAKPAEPEENTQRDIGGGVMVSQATLTRLEQTYHDAPCKFSRALIRVLFTDEELANKTLFGRQANSHKENKVKPALDQTRVSALLEYTCSRFKCSDVKVKRSLGSMLQKMGARNDACFEE
ncbi:uncharacterized protein [Dermacentor albipictus]|uniref:uncharacterized protein isoform X1 n=1 Tax=Dermacentor albipictus TaxID=60249 RepID=UPI0031FDE935